MPASSNRANRVARGLAGRLVALDDTHPRRAITAIVVWVIAITNPRTVLPSGGRLARSPIRGCDTTHSRAVEDAIDVPHTGAGDRHAMSRSASSNTLPTGSRRHHRSADRPAAFARDREQVVHGRWWNVRPYRRIRRGCGPAVRRHWPRPNVGRRRSVPGLPTVPSGASARPARTIMAALRMLVMSLQWVAVSPSRGAPSADCVALA